jgi:hypothetical protein
MIYIPVEKLSNGTAKVIYTSKDGRSRKTFDALDWLALLVTHIPARYEQTVRYYGYYSNKSRGLRKKADTDNQLPTIIAGEMSSREFRRNWARLIKKSTQWTPCKSIMPGGDARHKCDRRSPDNHENPKTSWLMRNSNARSASGQLILYPRINIYGWLNRQLTHE